MAAIEQTAEGLRIRLFLQPKASKDAILGLHDDELKVSITAPPVDGAANAHLLKYFSKQCKVPKSAILIERGKFSRHKQLFIPAPKHIPDEIKALL
ncbi:DUF167 family protein YggU [Pasteurellaceae bacterium LIM206]|nr:DUF167 family protein YggU [Pasteurellaceae bacterium LIM206]